MLLFSSALDGVPPSQMESARMAGASAWQQLRDVVIPNIRAHILTNTLLITLWTFNTFTPYLLTAGGPNGESEILPVYIYRTAIGLTLDTGHLLLGGGEPTEALSEWAGRINHLHLKDADRRVVEEVVRNGRDMRAVWTDRAFVPLGDGDLDLVEVMNRVLDSDFTGWLVVEQDVVPSPDDPPGQAQTDQIRNRDVLRRWFP